VNDNHTSETKQKKESNIMTYKHIDTYPAHTQEVLREINYWLKTDCQFINTDNYISSLQASIWLDAIDCYGHLEIAARYSKTGNPITFEFANLNAEAQESWHQRYTQADEQGLPFGEEIPSVEWSLR
jgi:hypothetical protein